MYNTKITKAGLIFDEDKFYMHAGSNETYLDTVGLHILCGHTSDFHNLIRFSGFIYRDF